MNSIEARESNLGLTIKGTGTDLIPGGISKDCVIVGILHFDTRRGNCIAEGYSSGLDKHLNMA